MSNVECYGQLERESNHAYLMEVIVDSGNDVREEKIWFPKSLTNITREENNVTYFEIPEWLATKKGLI